MYGRSPYYGKDMEGQGRPVLTLGQRQREIGEVRGSERGGNVSCCRNPVEQFYENLVNW